MKRLNVLLIGMVVFCLAIIAFLLFVSLNRADPTALPNETEPAIVEPATEPTIETEPTTEPVTEPEVEPETEPVIEPEQQTEEIIGMFSIETPYLNLKYPVEWKSYLQYHQTSTVDLHTVSFKCSVADQEVPLADVLFGHTDTGEQMGYLQIEDKVVPVCVLFYEFVPDDTWRDEDTFIVYAMQESVNDMISGIKAESNYLPQ